MIAVQIGLDRNIKTDNKWIYRIKNEEQEESEAIGACWDNLDGYEAIDMFLVENGGHGYIVMDGDPDSSEVFTIGWVNENNFLDN